MDKNKVEQIKDKICDHMLTMDLTSLSIKDLCTYINAYKSLEGFLFPGLGMGLAHTSNSSI